MTVNRNIPKIFLIAAVGLRGELGRGLDIPWMGRAKEDMRFFQSKTKEIGTLVMGYNTYLSLPKKLKDRNCLVLTTKPHMVDKEGFEPVSSLDEAIEKSASFNTDLAIVGGASVYTQSLQSNIVDEIYLNHILHPFDNCDVFFPMELIAKNGLFQMVDEPRAVATNNEGDFPMVFTHLRKMF